MSADADEQAWERCRAALDTQALACRRLGSPMYGDLLDRLVADVAERGVTREVLAGHRDDPGPSGLGLRLLGSVHRLVLERRAGRLATFYPSVGGTWDPDAGWTAFQALLAEHPEAVREWLDRPPQTNEVGRASALYGGLLQLPWPLPVRLLEIGSSAGLNLRADRFTYLDDTGAAYGARDDRLVLDGAWRGRSLAGLPEPRVVERVGSDVSPVDVGTVEGRLALSAYVWPDQTARFERLRAALDLARYVPAEVRAADAVAFVSRIRPAAGAVTVLWHSVMWQYVPDRDQAEVTALLEALGGQATEEAPVAHLFLEPSRREAGAEHEFLVVLTTWPGGERRILGHAAPHGVPVTWE